MGETSWCDYQNVVFFIEYGSNDVIPNEDTIISGMYVLINLFH